MGATIGFVAGLYSAQVAVVDQNNIALGQLADPTNPVNGTTYPAYRFTHPVEVTAPSPTRELATDQGGQKIRGQLDLGISSFGTFNMTVSNYDATLMGLVGGGGRPNSTTIVGTTMSGPNFMNPSLPQVCLLLHTAFQSRDTATKGTIFKATWVFPRVQIAPAAQTASQNAGVNPNSLQLTVTPSPSSKFITGQTYNDASPNGLGMDYTDGETLMHLLVNAYDYMLTTFIGDNAETDITLPYRPVSSDVALVSSANIVAENSVRVAPTSISTTTGVVVMSAAPGTAEPVVILAPTNWVAI